ncbi:MAG TPA: MobF family relaxase [Ilumatobacteraceae bacterium]|nr:MobF family relaxase [Ilumatobacteraceae bacterium]
MLSLAKLGRGSEGYYLDAVAKGAEDYYVGRGEAPGYWAGRGAELLGLDGEVTPEVLRAVLAGTAPDGSMLGAANRTVPGFDLTFSVPKSVSVLAALRPELSEQIVDACEVAVARSIAWLEDNACFSRRGHNGVEHVDGDGYVAAAFRHRTSRAGDPQLHWHVLVANTTRGPDGRWRTLDGTRVYPALRTAGFLFEAEMRNELTNRFGVQWRAARNGISEIDGAPAAVLRHFSKRRSQIEDRLAIKGYSSGRAAQVAALSTRDCKAEPESDQTLRERWQREAESIGFDPASLDQLLDRPRRALVLDDEIPTALSTKGLTHKKSTFTRLDALRDLAERAIDGARIDEVERVTSRLLEDLEAVDLGVDANGSEDVELRSGRRIGTVTRRYSTRELLALEQRIIDLAVRRSTTPRPQLLPSVTKLVLATKPGLSGEQRAAVHRLLTGERLVDCLIAAAGSGKTYSLNLAREMWEGSHYRVIGASLAARAAKELEDQAHIPSRTIAKLLIDLDRGTEKLDDRTVLVIDEAAMVGTRALARLFDAAEAGGSRLILVGDPHQLQSIEAGGVLRGLENRLPTIGLTENRRQRHAWERVALADLRAGEVGRFLTAYQAHGRIHIGDTADSAKQQLISHWSTQLRFKRDVVILALRRDDVADLNRLARGKMLEGRRLGPDALIAGDCEFRTGDRMVCLRNQRADGLLNGLRGVVTSIDPEARSLTVRLTDGTDRVVPAGYLDAGHLDHGYAMTIHKAQGLTADEALVLATDDLYREAGYTALSRARLATQVFVAADDFDDDPSIDLSHAVRQSGSRVPNFDLARSLGRSHADHLAIDR